MTKPITDSTEFKLANQKNNVLFLGPIPELEKEKYLDNAAVCPLPFDPKDSPHGGMRLKTLECLSYGALVISTEAGVAGIDGVENGENVLLENDLSRFPHLIVDAIMHPAKYEKLQKNGIQLAQRYLWTNTLKPYKQLVDKFN